MARWINWRESFERDMKNPEFKEEFDREYEEFKKQNTAELASDLRRLAAMSDEEIDYSDLPAFTDEELGKAKFVWEFPKGGAGVKNSLSPRAAKVRTGSPVHVGV